MKVKMFVTDLDGTLLRDDKTISERSSNAIKLCRAKGIKTVYATGRGRSTEIIAPSELFDGSVRMNGATAHVNDEMVYKRFLSADSVRDLLIAADNAGMRVSAENDGIQYVNFDISKVWSWITNFEETDFKGFSISIGRIYAVLETPEVLELVNKHLPSDAYIYVSMDGFIMVMHKEAKKSKAVAALAEHWGIKQTEIVAFGDDKNDIDLLEYCGISVAMGNALDEVKAAAEHICDTNENDGLAKWLEENVLECEGYC